MFEELFLATVVIWVGIGLALALIMGRRGHTRFGWLFVGAVLGPIALVLALTSWRQEAPPATRLAGATAAGTGPVDALVGYDGSPEALAAVDAVIGLLASRLGRLTVATVVPLGAGQREEESAAAALQALCSSRAASAAASEVLHGRPSEALSRRAVEGGYQLLAIGTRGTGFAKAAFGSTATELARASKLPVLMVGAETV
jgi:nucleotide-binding universal stress UspA family protein